MGFPIQNILTVQLLYQFFDPCQQLRTIPLFLRGTLLQFYGHLSLKRCGLGLGLEGLEREGGHAVGEGVVVERREGVEGREIVHLHRFYYLLQKRN